MSEDGTEERVETALKNYGESLKAAGIKPETKVTSELIDGVASLLSTDSDKMYLASTMYMFSQTDNERKLTSDWARNIYTANQNDKSLFSPLDKSPFFFVPNIQFVEQVSPEAVQSFIDASPVTFLQFKSLIQLTKMDASSMKPSRESLESAIKNLSVDSMSLGLMDSIEDPELNNYMRDKMSHSPYYAKSLLNDELKLKATGQPYNQEIVDRSFGLITGYKEDGNLPSRSKIFHIDMVILKDLATKAYGSERASEMMLKTAKSDPLAALTYTAQKYPEASDSIPIYLTALPQANALLNNSISAAAIVKMLNALEPSQYAGTPYKIIPEKDGFKLLDGASSGQLYDLITQQDSFYSYTMSQGTYNEVSKRLYETLKHEGKSFSEISNSSRDRVDGLMTYTKTADAFRRMDSFIKSTTPDDHLVIAEKLFEKEDKGYNISTMSSFMKNLPKNSPALAYMETTIASKAIAGDEHEKADMGLLARWYANQTTHTISPENRAFYDRVKSDPSFEIPPLNKIKSSNLLDAAGRNFQLHTFYNDKDGIDTFNSFSGALRADGYKLKKQNDFLEFSKEKNGREIKILVSPPESNGEAIPKILDYVKDQNGVISVLSGRGHSHHMEKAMDLITPDTKIVALGGCWGHNYTNAVLEKSPDAHILATTGVGRMAINNFNTKWMNDQILSGNDLNWQGLKAGWDHLKTDKTLTKDINEYVSPDDNIFLLYERRRNELYKTIEDQEQKNTPAPTSSLNQTFMQSVRGLPPATPSQNTAPASPVISEVRKAPESSLSA